MSARPKALVSSCDATRQAWRARLARFGPSAPTVVAFCHREHVSVPTFSYWKRRLGDARQAPSADAPRLLPVRLTAGPPPVEFLLPGGRNSTGGGPAVRRTGSNRGASADGACRASPSRRFQ